MNRAEQLAAKVAQEKALLGKRRQAVAQAKAQLRDETRKALNKRRYSVGALADEAGLLSWEDTDLQAVFRVLARYTSGALAEAVLATLLDESAITGEGETGGAESAIRVSAPH